jgi:BBSome-interacting protein 1
MHRCCRWSKVHDAVACWTNKNKNQGTIHPLHTHPPTLPDPPHGVQVAIQEVLPKAGLVYSEKGNLSEVMCKPKIMALKSVTLEKLEAMERDAKAAGAAAGGPGFGVSTASAPRR